MNLCIIGTGYVGLVTGAGMAELGNNVICVDVDREKMENLNRGKLPIQEEGLKELVNKNSHLGRLLFSVDIESSIEKSEVVFICVGTPQQSDGDIDLSQVISATENLAQVLNKYLVIVIRSTVPLGGLDVIRSILKKEGKFEGKDYDIAVVPEFLREGNAVYDFFHPTRIVIGTENESASKLLTTLFLPFKAPLIYTSPVAAQIIKYASNAYLATRISFINEIANICERVGVDVFNVIEGMKYDKRIGGDYFSPGVGFGGPCLVKDLNGFIKMFEKYQCEPILLRSVLERNERQKKSIIRKVEDLIGDSFYKVTIGVLGLTFKPNTNDVRNSSAINIIKILQKKGAKIKVYDPIGMEQAKYYLNPSEIVFCNNMYEAAFESDLLLILTAWEEFKQIDFLKLKSILKNPLIIDGVNVLDPVKVKSFGFVYKGVGRY